MDRGLGGCKGRWMDDKIGRSIMKWNQQIHGLLADCLSVNLVFRVSLLIADWKRDPGNDVACLWSSRNWPRLLYKPEPPKKLDSHFENSISDNETKRDRQK